MLWTAQQWKEVVEAAGAGFISVTTENRRRTINFTCSICGAPYKVQVDKYNRGTNRNFQCLSCMRKGLSKDVAAKAEASLKTHLESKGSVLLSPYKDQRSIVFVKCAGCGDQFTLTPVDIRKREKILCHKCLYKEQEKLEELRAKAEQAGATLLTTVWPTVKGKVRFLCAKCGKPHEVVVETIDRSNKNWLCPDCRTFAKPNWKEVEDFFAAKGVQLLSTEYKNNLTPLKFKCGHCGASAEITWKSCIQGANPNMLCKQCLIGTRLNPAGGYGHQRHLVDHSWFGFVYQFFNINELQLYAAHHIHPWARYPEEATSITNGFPLRKDLHARTYVDPVTKVHDPFHSVAGYASIEDWPMEAKLPFHTYTDFKFLDLASFVRTEIIAPTEDQFPQETLNKKLRMAEEGILYIPLNFEELFVPAKAQIVYSMLRSRLWRHFPDIYRYTNAELEQYQARKLECLEVSWAEAAPFLNATHIQGACAAEIYLALKDREEIIALMSFGRPRFNNGPEWELLRYSCKKDSFIAGGAQKLFKHFVRQYHPKTVISYCDLRFSEVNPDCTIYPKLGFVYQRRTAPAYHYVDPTTNRVYGRMKFQKHRLEKILENYDSSLTERENMTKAGYIRTYDCGNLVFLWEAK